MTSTPVRDIGPTLTQFSTGSPARTGAGAGISFKDVWQSHTTGNGKESNTAPNTSQQNRSSQKVQNEETQPGNSLKARETQQDSKTKETVGQKELQETDGESLSEEELTEAMEALGTAAMQFAQLAAEELGLTPEELSSLLEELGMDQLDLLVPENLTKLVLAAGKTEDSLSLLMNEDLYQSLQNLDARLKEIMTQVSSDTGLSQEELEGLLKNPDLPAAEKESVPVISVETVNQADYLTAVQETDQQPEMQDEKQTVTGREQQTSDTAIDTESIQADNVKGNRTGGEASGQHEKSSADNGRQESFLTNLTQQLEQSVAGQAAEVGSDIYADNQPEAIMKQIMDYMKLQLKPDMSSLEMQLHPESLGTLHVQLTTRQGAVTAQFITQNEAVKTALESQMLQLKENFDEQGIRVENIEVTVQTHEFEHNLDQGNRGQQESSGKKNRTRRLNLNIPEDMGDISAEEKMTADIMAASGNTVDYTA